MGRSTPNIVHSTKRDWTIIICTIHSLTIDATDMHADQCTLFKATEKKKVLYTLTD